MRPSYQHSVEFDRPRTIYFYATSHCNSNCAYCAFRISNNEMPRMHMPLETIRKTWLNSSILSECGLVIQGGEFTIHPEALQIVQFFRSLVPKITLLTNAVDPYLTPPLLPYVNQITISLDGPKHDISRGVKGNLTNVHSLLSMLGRFKGPKTLQITLGPWNAKDIPQATDSVDYLLEACLDYDAQPRFNIASDDGLLGISHYANSSSVLKEVADGLIMLARHPRYAKIANSMKGGANYILAALAKRDGDFIPCVSTSIYSTINANGDVWLCQGLNEHEAVIGNIYKEGFDKIWEDSREKRMKSRECQLCTLSCQLTGDLAYIKSV